MRKFWFSLAVFFGSAGLMFLSAMLTGCQSPVSTGSGSGVRYVVVNSKWETVQTGSRSARSIEDIEAEIDEYNAETLDDFLRLYYETVPDLSEAPAVSVYIVNPVTHFVNTVAEGVARTELVENEAAWRRQAYGQILYIDHVPPAPEPMAPIEKYTWLAIYAVDQDGKIQYETHCGYLPDGTFDGQWIYDGGWRSPEHYYETKRAAFWSEVVSHPGWILLEHKLYTEPQP